MAERTRRRKGFLEKYRLDDAYLRRPDKAVGRVGLCEGIGPDGEPVLVKIWPRQSRQNDNDLESIWRNEIRQLHRMAGHPAAHEVIARLVDAGSDKDGFYLVIEPGQRRPIAPIIERGRTGHWLVTPRLPANRVRIWQNCKRIARAVEVLHSEGMLHRDLDAWSVLSAGGEELDFQLTGFEWSMRLATSANGSKVGPRKAADGAVSFRGDWAAFGELVARLIGADWKKVKDLSIPAFEVADHLYATEVRLLRNLAGLEVLDRLDGDIVLKQIDQILTTVIAEASGKQAKLNLVLDLRPTSQIGKTIAAHFETDTMSIAADLPQIVEDDLSEGPLLAAVSDDDGQIKLMLRGHDFWYRLAPYRAPKSLKPSWEFAQCQNIATQGPAQVNVIGTMQLAPASLDIMSLGEAPVRFARSRGKVRSWDAVRTQMTAKNKDVDSAVEFHRALTLTLIVELLFAVAETFPVKLVPTANPSSDEDTIIQIIPRRDSERGRLSEALDIVSPAMRLHAVLTTDGVRREGWILTAEENLGQRGSNDGEWKFECEIKREGAQSTYQFRGSAPPNNSEALFLVPEDSVGRDTQLRRRLKALGALREHLELQRALTSPALELTSSHDPVPEDKDLLDLDISKRETLRNIIDTLPLFLVQGPPGVGKTRLVRELVKRRFHEDPALRFLLSAQSNAAVDHLLSEVVPAMQAIETEPLIIRSGSGREGEDLSDYRLAKVSRDLLANIAGSELVANARPALQENFNKLKRDARTSAAKEKGEKKTKYPAVLRTFEGVVMRAANIVFATTNSADLERLIEEHSQFDWSIIEEAGKATGSELIAPQLLSHRRLMIGDHKQLPPFNADQMIQFLSMPERVVQALTIGAEFIGRSLRDETTEAILDEVEESPETAAPLCARAIETVTLFQTLIEREFKRRVGKTGRTFAKRLSEQHRMHPVIANLIGDAFYADHAEGRLVTHAESIKRFANEPCPVRSLDPSRLPEVPIVLVNIEAKQLSQGRVRGEETPTWHNCEERDAVRLVLEQIRPATDTKVPPTIAILSPYTQQVNRLAEMVRSETTIDPTANGFEAPAAGHDFCFTVDSFQGSEADVAIVSLVRNNARTSIRNALGFLADFRRMNVLLSRAKWRLILIGSFDFLREVLESARLEGKSSDIEFLGTLFDNLAGAEVTAVRRVSIAELRGDVP